MLPNQIKAEAGDFVRCKGRWIKYELKWKKEGRN